MFRACLLHRTTITFVVIDVYKINFVITLFIRIYYSFDGCYWTLLDTEDCGSQSGRREFVSPKLSR